MVNPKLDGFGNSGTNIGGEAWKKQGAGDINENLQVGDNIQLGSRKVRIATEEDLEMFRRGENAGESLDELMSKLERTYTVKYELPDEDSLREDFQKPENIAKIMEGETRPEVYIVVRSSKTAGERGYTRILLRREGNHYKVQDEPFSNKDSSKLQPKDKIILAEGGPATVQ